MIEILKAVYSDIDAKDRHKSGIYMIQNIVNNKKYVGSTTVSFAYRWGAHSNQLRKNKHHSFALQKDWNKYGAESFRFSILEVINQKLTTTTIFPIEKGYMDKHTSLYPNGYNISSGNDGGYEVVNITKYYVPTENMYNVIKKLSHDNKLPGESIRYLYDIDSGLLSLITANKSYDDIIEYCSDNPEYKEPPVYKKAKSKMENGYRKACMGCACYSDDDDYCEYYEVNLPNNYIFNCDACTSLWINDDEKYLLTTFKARTMDEVIENYLNGKLF